MRLTARGQSSTLETVHQLDASRAHASAQAEGVVLDVGHRLGAARDHEACASGGDLRGTVQHRLQARTATSIDLHAGDSDAEARIERRDSAQSRRLTVRIALPKDHVVDIALAEAGTRGQFTEQSGGEIGDRHRRESTSHAADRRSQRGADHDICGGVHVVNPTNRQPY